MYIYFSLLHAIRQIFHLFPHRFLCVLHALRYYKFIYVCFIAPFSHYTIALWNEYNFGTASWEAGKFVGKVISLHETGVFLRTLLHCRLHKME